MASHEKEKKETAKHTGIHSQAPTIIASALITGSLLALGHHLFYQSLHGHVAPSAQYSVLGTYVSQQQVNIAIGTAFAFLVKAFLVTALAIAYVQLLWRDMLRANRHATLTNLDAVFSGLTDFFSLFKVWIWFRYPLLFMLALLAWLIPITSIITPATLSIESEMKTHSQMQNVPNVQFVSMNYVGNMLANENGDAPSPAGFTYNGPSRYVQQTANQVGTTGAILDIQSPGPNTHWMLDFAGPALKCNPVNETSRSNITTNIAKAFLSGSCTAYSYIAWTYGSDLPFTRSGNGTNATYSQSSDSVLDEANAMGFYLAALPSYLSTVISTENGGYVEGCYMNVSALETALKSSTLLQCQLLNATYEAQFEYEDGRQNITLNVQPNMDQPVQALTGIQTASYSAGCEGDDLETGPECALDGQLLSQLSYTEIMDAFQRLVLGSIYVHNDGSYGAFIPSLNSTVLDTVLVQTPELAYLNPSSDGDSLQYKIEYFTGQQGLTTSVASEVRGSLETELEQLFQNMTISLMSYPQLRPNLTSSYAPPPANVSFQFTQSYYVYSAVKLWIAYGLAILLSTIAAAIGILALIASGASYSDNFSSIFRVAQRSLVKVKDEDTDGRDPLPSHLSNVPLGLEQQRSNEEVEVGKGSDVGRRKVDQNGPRSVLIRRMMQ